VAIYNEILVGRYARMLQKLFSMKGGVPVKQLAGELMAVLPVFAGVELRYLESWNRFGATVNQAAAVGVPTNVRIRNPVGSGVVAVLESIHLDSTVVLEVLLRRSTTDTDYANVFTTFTLDPRSGGALTRSSSVFSGNQIATLGGFNIGDFLIPANQGQELIANENQEITLLPGISYDLSTVAVNVALIVSLKYRERVLEESERA